MMGRTGLQFVVATALALLYTGADPESARARSTAALPTAPTQLPRDSITVSFYDTPIRDVLFAFAEFSGRSIVAGAQVEGLLSAEIRGQPWDVALRTLVEAYGLVVHEQEDGIIRVEDAGQLFENEAVLPVATR
ncbi:MAG: hypothetical protein OXF01_03920, partial [Gemmatimonadetes bacterium]|nr:hypothetical protein [Gemmatimonadota bacterium]